MKKSRAVLMALSIGVIVCVVTSLLTIVIYRKTLEGGENGLDLSEFVELEDIIDEYYLYDYDMGDVQDAAMKAMIESLDDPYTVYFTEEEFEQFNQSSAGEYEGIGMIISEDEDTGYAVIVKFFEGSDALEQGMQEGDLIVEIDGVDVRESSMSEIGDMCLGEEGTYLTMTVLRDGQEHTYELERRAITVDMAQYEVLEDGIGYISIYQFSGNALDIFEEAVAQFEQQGVEGVVIDLRDNPGGYMSTVVDMLDIILPEGKIVYTEDKYGYTETQYSDEKCLDFEFTILVNGNTASASEIFAGAMQDYDYAEVVGTTTFGKGVVQVVLPLNNSDGGVKLTVSEYYTPDGRSINGSGIEPDHYIEAGETDEDIQLQKALEVLKTSLAG